MCIRDRDLAVHILVDVSGSMNWPIDEEGEALSINKLRYGSVSYTHLRAHETVLDLVCRLLLEKKKNKRPYTISKYVY